MVCFLCNKKIFKRDGGWGWFMTSQGRQEYHKICEVKRRLQESEFKGIFNHLEIERLMEIFELL